MNVQNDQLGIRYLSPRTLARAIGVSESSLKRWADEGRFTVERTVGGHRRIALPEAVQFIRRSRLTAVRPDLLGLHGGTQSPWSRPDASAAAERLYEALVEDRSEEGRNVVVSLYVDGSDLAWIFDGVVRPALARIGELWEHGDKGIFLEHRATETCLRALVQLRMIVPPVGDDAPVAVGGAFEGDAYQIPSAMAGLVLAEAGFRDHDLGADVPASAMIAAVEHYRPQLVWQSMSGTPRSVRDAARVLEELAEAAGDGTLVVGGRGADGVGLPARDGAHRFNSMSELSAFARGVRPRL